MKPRAIIALDVPDAEEAAVLLERLGAEADFVKVGSELFTGAGPALVSRMRAESRDVFLDLKWHDIPTTVRKAARVASRMDVRLVTVHACGGRAMLDAAIEGAGSSCGVLAVTVLTSLTAAALGDAIGRPVARVEDEVMRLAEIARGAGAHGIVCSGAEAAMVRATYGNTLRLLVPGIRLPGGDVHDQARAVTPERAVAAGATYLVVGRAVTAATEPREALAAIRRAIAG
ncbi:MAG: orotidine-5'-phosphate decarboxylase [Gemmatimonadota bacterium]|nr:orotidine-5'-phosphate decarboxylase [Gemmatimonadota bacterium]